MLRAAAQALQSIRSSPQVALYLTERIAKRIERDLGPQRMATLRTAECTDVRERMVAALSTFVTEMSTADGTPDSVGKINRASGAYLAALKAVYERTAPDA